MRKVTDSTMNNVVSLEFAKEHMYYPHRDDLQHFKKLLNRYGLLKNYERCCICDWGKATIDMCHVAPHKGGFHYTYDNIVPLRPNHHRLFDRGLLSPIETEAVQFFLWNISNIFCPF